MAYADIHIASVLRFSRGEVSIYCHRGAYCWQRPIFNAL